MRFLSPYLTLLAATATVALAATPKWEPLREPGVGGWSVSLQVSPFESQRVLIGGDVLGTAYSEDGARNWEPALGFSCWEMGDFTFHPSDRNVVWAGTLGGPYQSKDGGKSWALKRNGFPPIPEESLPSAPIQKVVFDPNNPNVLLAIGGNHRQMVKPNKTTRFGAIWRSADGGEHWTRLTTLDATGSKPADRPGVNLTNVGFAARSSEIVYTCSFEGGVYKSTDGGKSFNLANRGLPNTAAWFIALHPADPNTLWVALGKGGRIYKTTDGATTWQPSFTGLDSIGPEQTCSIVIVCPSDPRVLYTCGSRWQVPSPVCRSMDGGETWTEVIKNRDRSKIIGGTAHPGGAVTKWMSVDPNDPKCVFALTESGYVIRSRDAGETWHDITAYAAGDGWRGNGYSGKCGTRVKWNPFRPEQLFTLGWDSSKLLRSNDDAWSWTIDASPLATYNGGQDVTYARDGTIYVGFGQRENERNESIGKSTDGGRTWAYIPRPAGAKGANTGVYVLPDDSKSVWAVMGNGFYRSRDGGTTWSSIPLENAGTLFGLEPAASEPLTIYVAAQNGIFRSTDGEHFTLIPGSPTGKFSSSVTVDPKDASLIYVTTFVFGQTGVRRYDGQWKMLLNKKLAYRLAVDPGNTKRLAVLTKDWPARDVTRAEGVWLSEDGGEHWTQSAEGLGQWRGSAIAFNPNRSGQLIVGTDGNGFFTTDWGTSTPFGGEVRNVTTTIEAEDYDVGGEGIAFHRTAKNSESGDGYRRDAAGIRKGGSGRILSGLAKDDWLKYRVAVPATAYYDFTLRVASAEGQGRFHLVANGVNVSGPIAVADTKAAEAWTNVVARGVRLHAGEQYLTLLVDAPGADIDLLLFTPGAAP